MLKPSGLYRRIFSDYKDVLVQQLQLQGSLMIFLGINYSEDFTTISIWVIATLFLIKVMHGVVQQIIEQFQTTNSLPVPLSFLAFPICLSLLDFIALRMGLASNAYFIIEYKVLAIKAVSTLASLAFCIVNSQESHLRLKHVYTFRLAVGILCFYICLYCCLSGRRADVELLVVIAYEELKKFIDNFQARCKIKRVSCLPDVNMEQGSEMCTICQEEATTVKRLPCGHYFHALCLLDLQDPTCPNCRRRIFLPVTVHEQAMQATNPQPDTKCC